MRASIRATISGSRPPDSTEPLIVFSLMSARTWSIVMNPSFSISASMRPRSSSLRRLREKRAFSSAWS
ncbi:MAG: hypothetical protein EBU23_09490 [Mycobacteriaceae bacterium]|nr:hypothetical protein [Mycobacteriaceae bacterium]